MDINTAVFKVAGDNNTLDVVISQGKSDIAPSDSPDIAYVMYFQYVARSNASLIKEEPYYQLFDFTGAYLGRVPSNELSERFRVLALIIQGHTQNGRSYADIYADIEVFLNRLNEIDRELLNGNLTKGEEDESGQAAS